MAALIFLLFFTSLHSATPPRGFTIHQRPLSPPFLKQLAETGIDLTFGTLPPPSIEKNSQAEWKQGTLFLQSFNQRGETFENWLSLCRTWPSQRVKVEKSRPSAVP